MVFDSPIEELSGVGTKRGEAFHNYGIFTIGDLLRWFPYDYRNVTLVTPISQLELGDGYVVIRATVLSCTSTRTRNPRFTIQKAIIEDDTGQCDAQFFNQPYLTNTLPGHLYYFVASVDFVRGKNTIKPIEWYSKESVALQPLIPKYSAIKGIPKAFVRNAIRNIVQNMPTIEDLPSEIINTSRVLSTYETFTKIHCPKQTNDVEKAHERVEFDQLLLIMNKYREIAEASKKHRSYAMSEKNSEEKFVRSLPYSLTDDQDRSIQDIKSDFKKDTPMNRILIGDVGTGKTVVAAAGAYLMKQNGCKTVIFAPSELLAQQHYQNLTALFLKHTISVGLYTAKNKKEYEIADVTVATHALLYSLPELSKVGLVVIDEQHKFGVEQRDMAIKLLGNGAIHPHVLSMTATPIPRSLAILLFGGLSQSYLRSHPPGKIPIKTRLIDQNNKKEMFRWLSSEITENNTQAFVVCPAIESDEGDVSTVGDVRDEIEKYMPHARIAVIHSREKMAGTIMEKFKQGKIDVLIATTIIEVGIDVPNASVMILYDADYFGLAQLHQLRGRVGRGSRASWCFLIPSKHAKNTERLTYLQHTSDGFAVSEFDLKTRGPGSVIGYEQKGYTYRFSFNPDLIDRVAMVKKVSYTSPLVTPVTTTKVNRLH